MKTPCPFCGNTDHYIAGFDQPNASFYVHCMSCGAKGPMRPSMHSADQAWAIRAEPGPEAVNELKKDLGLYNNG